MKYEAEIWHLKVTYDADFDYDIKIFNQLAKLMEFDDVIIFEDNENMKLRISW